MMSVRAMRMNALLTLLNSNVKVNAYATSAAAAVISAQERARRSDKSRYRKALEQQERLKQQQQAQQQPPPKQEAPPPPPPDVVPMPPVEPDDAQNIRVVERGAVERNPPPPPERMVKWQTVNVAALSNLIASLERAFADGARPQLAWCAASLQFAVLPPLNAEVFALASNSSSDSVELVPYVGWLKMCELLRLVQLTSGARAAAFAVRIMQLVYMGCTRNTTTIGRVLGALSYGEARHVVAAHDSLAELGLLDNEAVYNSVIAALSRCGEVTKAVQLARDMPDHMQLDADSCAALMLALQYYVSYDSIDVILRQWMPTPPPVVLSALVRVLVDTHEITAAIETYNLMLNEFGPCMDAFHAIIFGIAPKRYSRCGYALVLIAHHRALGLYLSPAVLIVERKLARMQLYSKNMVETRMRGQAFARELSVRTILEERARRPNTLLGAHINRQIQTLMSDDMDDNTPGTFEEIAETISNAGRRVSYIDLTREALTKRYDEVLAAVKAGEADEAELPAIFIDASLQLSALDQPAEALCALQTMVTSGFMPRASDVEPILECITRWDATQTIADYRTKITDRYKLFREILDRMTRWRVQPPPNAFMMLLRFGVRTRRFGSIVSLIDSMRSSFAPLPPTVLWRVLHRALCEDSLAVASAERILDLSRHATHARYQESRNVHLEALLLNRLPSLAASGDALDLRNELSRDLPTALLNVLHRAGRTDPTVLPEFVDYFEQLRHHVTALSLREFRRSNWHCFHCRTKCRQDATMCKCGKSFAESVRD
jgi:pentatricopeptide repeat protein